MIHFDEKFWLAIAFFAFLLLLAKYVFPTISKSLGNKSQDIAKELLEAKELKEKAAKLLEAADQYHKESQNFAKKLLEDAQKEADKFLQDAQASIAKDLEKKTAAAKVRIQYAEENALKQVQRSIIASAINEIQKEAEAGLNKEQSDYIIKEAAKTFEKIA